MEDSCRVRTLDGKDFVVTRETLYDLLEVLSEGMEDWVYFHTVGEPGQTVTLRGGCIVSLVEPGKLAQGG